MDRASYTLFDTTLGLCGIVWNVPGAKGVPLITGFQLPEATSVQAEARIQRKWKAKRASSVPAPIRQIIQRVRRHFEGKPQDFSDIELRLDAVGAFARTIYTAARTIPAGRTLTYGKLAEIAGCAGAARSVGQALGRNPIPLIVPCHRVVAAAGGRGGFSAYGGLTTKAKMLEIEGVIFGRPATIRNRRDLTRAAARLGKQDPRLARLFLFRPIDFKWARTEPPYHTLMKAVVHQQLSPKAAKTILGRVIALYGHSELPQPAEILDTDDREFRKAGLSNAKTRSLREIALGALNGTIPSAQQIKRLSDEEIIARLTSIYGIGRWTVEMMLIFNLGRIDVLPVDDYALRVSIAENLEMGTVPSPGEVKKLGDLWRPYRTVAALSLWQAKDNDVGLEPSRDK